MQEGILSVESLEHSPNEEVVYITCSLQNGDLDFEEGQFLTLQWAGFKKPYSIASTHNELMENNTISFVVKNASEAGMSHGLTKLIKVGDEITFQGPLGRMTDNKEYRKYLLVSIGSGLGPLYAHYKHIVQENDNFDKIVNLFGEKTEDDLIPSIKTDFNQDNDNIKIKNLVFISRQDTVSKGLELGHVQDKIDEALVFLGDTNFVAFLCGKPQMVVDVKQKLLDAGLDESQIKLEMY